MTKTASRAGFILVFCFSFLALAAPYICFAEVVDKIAAVVNDQTITASELDDAAKPMGQQKASSQERKEVLERLIEEKLILQEAKKFKMPVSNAEIDAMLKQVKSKFPNEKAFYKAMQDQGLNLWELKKTYKDQIMVKKMVRQYVREYANITPVQITEFYDAHIDDYSVPDAVDISQILIKYKPNHESLKTEKTALKIAQILDTGVDFESVARKYSEGPNRKNSGHIGFVNRGDMAKEIDDVISNMKEGEISKPIKLAVGFSIIKVNSIRKEQHMPIEEVKGDIEDRLLDESAKNVLGKWVKELREKAFISIKD